jgi:hypothetical protein
MPVFFLFETISADEFSYGASGETAMMQINRAEFILEKPNRE